MHCMEESQLMTWIRYYELPFTIEPQDFRCCPRKQCYISHLEPLGCPVIDEPERTAAKAQSWIVWFAGILLWGIAIHHRERSRQYWINSMEFQGQPIFRREFSCAETDHVKLAPMEGTKWCTMVGCELGNWTMSLPPEDVFRSDRCLENWEGPIVRI